MIRRMFDPERPVYAVKPLTTLGVEFGRGEEVDWKAFDFPQQRVQAWFKLRLISHFPGGDQSPEAIEFYKGPGRKQVLTTGAKPRRRRTQKVETAPVVADEVPAEVIEVTDEETSAEE